MRRITAKPVVPDRIIKIGGLYRDTARGVLVEAEDHEILGGQRTGRIVVCAADGKERFPRRWYCQAAALAEVKEEFRLHSPVQGAST
jgi:hypothetical protein